GRVLRQEGRRRGGERPAGAEAGALRGEGEARHLPVHERGAEPGRHVRPQAGAGEIPRHAVPRQDPRRLERAADRAPDEVTLPLPDTPPTPAPPHPPSPPHHTPPPP